MSSVSVDEIPVAHTPAGGWREWPLPVLAGCTDPVVEGAPDIDGFWRITAVSVNGERVPEHPALGMVQRIEQRGDRVVVTAGRIIHDMRCDGTYERGCHDVAEFDLEMQIDVVASYEDGVHVLRPEGLDLGAGPIEVRRWREGRHMLWEYVGFTATCELLAPSQADPASVVDG